MHDTVATSGQCLALSKAWWSCYRYVLNSITGCNT